MSRCPHCGLQIEVRFAAPPRSMRAVGPLTARQAQCYAFIREQITTTGGSPSINEIREALGLRGDEAVRRLVIRLEQLGYIRRRPGGRRAIELVDPLRAAS